MAFFAGLRKSGFSTAYCRLGIYPHKVDEQKSQEYVYKLSRKFLALVTQQSSRPKISER